MEWLEPGLSWLLCLEEPMGRRWVGGTTPGAFPTLRLLPLSLPRMSVSHFVWLVSPKQPCQSLGACLDVSFPCSFRWRSPVASDPHEIK